MSVTITSNPSVATISSSGLQGATGPGYAATSVTSFALAASGSKAFTTQQGLAYSAGARVRAASAGSPSNWMEGIVSSYSGTTLIATMDLANGSGTFADWNINLTGEPGVGGGGGSAVAWKRADFSSSCNGILEEFTLPITGGQSIVTDSEQVFGKGGRLRIRAVGYTIANNVVTTIGADSPYDSGDDLYVMYQETV